MFTPVVARRAIHTAGTNDSAIETTTMTQSRVVSCTRSNSKPSFQKTSP